MPNPHQIPLVEPTFHGSDDDWDTDPSFVNDVSAKQSRYGSKTVPETLEAKSTTTKHLGDLYKETIEKNDQAKRQEYLSGGANFNRGYGPSA